MPITATCPSCGRRKSMPDQFRWRRVRCPKCRAEFILKPEPVPSSLSEEIDYASHPSPGAATPGVNPLKVIGIILLCAGLTAASWFFVNRFTNLLPPSDRREHHDGP
jgi:hypothetical protein